MIEGYPKFVLPSPLFLSLVSSVVPTKCANRFSRSAITVNFHLPTSLLILVLVEFAFLESVLPSVHHRRPSPQLARSSRWWCSIHTRLLSALLSLLDTSGPKLESVESLTHQPPQGQRFRGNRAVPARRVWQVMASAVFVGASAPAAVASGMSRPGALNFHHNFVGEQIGCRAAQQKRGFALSAVQPLSSGRLRRNARVLAQATATSPVPVIDPELQDSLKRAVAKKAVQLVKPGNVVGLGTGSTSSMAIEELGKLIQAGKLKDVVGVGTSYQARVLARQFGVKTVDLNDVNHIDIAFDGADEVDRSMNLIKGGGAAHTLEKVVDTMAKKVVILVDQSKVVSELGLTFPVPVEVLPPAISPVLRSLVAIGGEPEIRSALRKDGPVITDLGNMIVDVRFPNGIKDAAALEREINNIPGVVENGLFVGIVNTVLVATRDGDETTIVELADFVQSLPTKEEAAGASS